MRGTECTILTLQRIRGLAALIVLAVLCVGCDEGDDEIEFRTILWNSTSEHGPASVFVAREGRDLAAIRERVGDRDELINWPSLDFRFTVVVVYVDGASDAPLPREGMYIRGGELRDDELILQIDPGDDLFEDDNDVQRWDFQAIALDSSSLPEGRVVRVVTPKGETLAMAK